MSTTNRLIDDNRWFEIAVNDWPSGSKYSTCDSPYPPVGVSLDSSAAGGSGCQRTWNKASELFTGLPLMIARPPAYWLSDSRRPQRAVSLVGMSPRALELEQARQWQMNLAAYTRSRRRLLKLYEEFEEVRTALNEDSETLVSVNE